MKTIISAAIMLATLGLLTGCDTTGLSRREQANVTYPHYILNLRSRSSPGAAPKPVTPMRIAVVQVGEPAPPQAMLEKLRARPARVASAVGLPSWVEAGRQTNNTALAAEQVQAMCRLAQAVAADYVFVFGGNMSSWCDGNAMRVLDVTLVGAALFPSTKIYAEGKAAGTLIHAGSCEPVLLVSVDVKRATHAPTSLTDGKAETLRVALRNELTAGLTEELLKSLSHNESPATDSRTDGNPVRNR